MATVTKAVFDSEGVDATGNPQGRVAVQYDYDDATLRITALRCINTSGRQLYAEAVLVSNGRKYSGTFLPGTTTEVPVPTGPAVRLQLFVNPTNGRLDGVETRILYPYVVA